MKKLILLLALLAFGGTCKAEQIYFEAESAQLTGFSAGDSFIWATASNAGTAIFKINIKTAGKYALWGRFERASDAENSVFVTMNTGTKYVWMTPVGTRGTFAWDRFNDSEFDLPEGEHTLTISGRESNTKVDMFLLTNELSLTPLEILLYKKKIGELITFAWNWEQSNVTEPSFKFRGVKEKTSTVIFQGETAQKEIPIKILSEEDSVRFEVKAVGKIDGVLKESIYGTSKTHAAVQPWLIQTRMSNPSNVIIE
jgi:hypothetical protein